MISLILILLLLMTSCQQPAGPAPASKPAAKVENRVKESELTRVTLTVEAEQRLGITLATPVAAQASMGSSISGEILLIPGNSLTASAPMSGMVHFVATNMRVGKNIRKGEPLFRIAPLVGPQRDIRITYEADAQATQARLNNATQQLARARQLLKDLAGSQRNVEVAEQEFAQATAAQTAALNRLKWLEAHPYEADLDVTIAAPETGVIRQLQVSEGQLVAGGAPLIEVADFGRVWLRLPVFAAERNLLGNQNTIIVRDLDGKGKSREAQRVSAPPTADPLSATSDLYFELANPSGDLNPGQRMSVAIPGVSATRALRIPASALVYDVHGGAWVYVAGAPHVFSRQRVELVRTEGNSALISRGLATSAQVVTSGVAELFGTEFGAGK